MIYMKVMDYNYLELGLFFLTLTIFSIFVTYVSIACTIIGENVRDSNQSVTMSMRPDPCIDENARILERYPTLQYSKAKYCNNNNTSSTCSCCSICLLDYKESDLVRVLSECNHFFHSSCVDPWLIMNLTCPICRKRY
ncbi:putative transcription factor C2H2 family [Lupinus albus]|uniref:Putative transcription factor C2H2 family n=1 Tax=Lupinus albus TaxID=3870 RepID=A0A6A4NLN2_LUPAL|nr:putative transcription factor C2H2 family [Lupinus albus]